MGGIGGDGLVSPSQGAQSIAEGLAECVRKGGTPEQLYGDGRAAAKTLKTLINKNEFQK